MNLEDHIRSIPDFPKPGIIFRDITTLLKEPHAFRTAIGRFADHFRSYNVTKVAAIESRGFLFGGAVAEKLGVGLVPVRKKGKLPHDTIQQTYDLEYGTDVLEMHRDALDTKDRVLIIDDLLATGGTLQAAVKLVEQLGARVSGIGCLIELSFLRGRDKLKGYDILSLVEYEAE